MRTNPKGEAMIDLYTWKTTNGRRPIIMLEETGTPYRIIPINIHDGSSRTAEYLKISPAGKVPCLVDPDGPDGASLHLMESAAILMYLAEKAGGGYIGTSPRNRWEVMRWVFFHATNVAITFSALNRAPVLESRCRDLLEAMNTHLADNEYFAGDYSIADMVPISRFWGFKFDAIDLGEYPNVVRWRDQLVTRPAIRHAMEVPIVPLAT